MPAKSGRIIDPFVAAFVHHTRKRAPRLAPSRGDIRAQRPAAGRSLGSGKSLFILPRSGNT
jgi:hypothetical protein